MTASRQLSTQQVETFRRDGFLVIPGYCTPGEMQRLQAWTDQVQTWPEVSGTYMMYFETDERDAQRRLLNRMENLAPYHAGFAAWFTGEKIMGAVSDLFDEPAVLFKDKINFKLAGGGGFAPHQDVQAGWDRYASLHITAMICIDACTRENGCLEVSRGCHRRGMIGDSWKPLDDQAMSEMTFEAVKTAPGDAIFFDSFAPHRSGPNRSNVSRRVLYLTYNRRSEGDRLAQYYTDKRKSYPPDCERQAGKEYVFKV